jgi:AcrR family transcriptional regulator
MLCSQGVPRATISDIFAEANISPWGASTNYFACKEAIIAGMAEGKAGISAESFNRVVEGPNLIAASVAGIERGKAQGDPKGTAASRSKACLGLAKIAWISCAKIAVSST